ncbi:hypothetical protein XELAEV_18047279mg [Xenopus laevis]|uniref:Uncharacterized protein n=1 Tax=Xenopus laevis TaxID=8355 RepID=A0A974BUU3_XENLA|nr:hypothetical protein XELAEV_18047279mg [Xenopus laevis]
MTVIGQYPVHGGNRVPPLPFSTKGGLCYLPIWTQQSASCKASFFPSLFSPLYVSLKASNRLPEVRGGTCDSGFETLSPAIM